MSFFDKKEEVIDLQLTQYGKHLLSRGKFRPVYYCFYDDDILYDSTKAGFTEEQNDTETRILEETPRLKTRHINYGVETFSMLDQSQAQESSPYRSSIFEAQRNNIFFDNTLKNRDLLYRLADKEISTQAAPNYDVLSLDSEFKETEEVEYQQHLVNRGVIGNVPQLSSDISVLLIKNIENPMTPRRITREDSFDPTSERLVFADNTMLELQNSSLTLNIEENEVYDGTDNFMLEIYEMHPLPEGSEQDHYLRRLDSMEEINYLFHIRTDNSVDSSVVEYRNQRQRNNQRRQD